MDGDADVMKRYVWNSKFMKHPEKPEIAICRFIITCSVICMITIVSI